MKKNNMSIRNILLDLLIFAGSGCVLGIMNGIIISGQSTPVNNIVDPTRYQNIAITIGTIIGFGIVLLGLISYLVLIRFISRDILFHFKLPLVLSGIVGVSINLLTYNILNRLADQYGIVPRTGGVILFDSIITAIMGAGFGIIIIIVIFKIRGYEQ
jgi:uncharacterized membrane protein YedE/YeeE